MSNNFDEHAFFYVQRLHRRVMKILYMFEEESPTLEKYIESLSREMVGNSKIFCNDELLSIAGKINGLDYSSHKNVRKDIFDACNIIEDVQKRFSYVKSQ